MSAPLKADFPPSQVPADRGIASSEERPIGAGGPPAAGPELGVPPGPATPVLWQSALFYFRQPQWFNAMRERYGSIFTIRVLGFPPFVMIGDPALAKQVFTAPPDRLHAGRPSPLGAVLGRHSLLAIDEAEHLEQRRLLLPPFHGERMQSYAAVIEQIANDEFDSWPADGTTEFETLASMQRITLRTILRTIFGARGTQLELLENLIPKTVDWGTRLVLFPVAQRDWGRFSPWGRFKWLQRQVFDQLDALIDEARHDPQLADRTDVLALLVQATHEDGSPMSDEEIRDELLTLLIAGHETTASSLGWAVERLRRHPRELAKLAAAVDAGERDYVDAVIREVLRVRPVVAFAGRAVAYEPFQVGEWLLPVGTRIALDPWIAHNDPELFDDPGRFDPERFAGRNPDTYSWIPFGGGIRRCIGASFAHMEMDIVLRTMLKRFEVVTTEAADEAPKFRPPTFAPRRGARVAVVARA